MELAVVAVALVFDYANGFHDAANAISHLRVDPGAGANPAAVMGVGATKRFSAVRWGVARSNVTAWVLTFPMPGSIAALAYGASHLVLE